MYYQISNHIRCAVQYNVYSPSTQSSFVKGNSTLILFVNEKHVAMFSSIFWRSRTDVFCQNFAFSYIFLWYITHEPVSEFSVVSSPPRHIRIYDMEYIQNFTKKKCLHIRNNIKTNQIEIIFNISKYYIYIRCY